MRGLAGRMRSGAALVVAAVLTAGCGTSGATQQTGQARAAAATPPESAATPSQLSAAAGGNRRDAPGGSAQPQVLATRLRVPWGLAFLPDGSALVTERDSGRILRLVPGRRPQVAARVRGVDAGGEGGLLGIAVAPTYRQDRLVYVYYTAARDNRVVRFRLGSSGRPQVVVDGIPKARNHNGGRIAFGPDGMLYVGTGDAGEAGAAQNRSSLAGKILRVRPDGGVPADNPFRRSGVYSLGHRNVQGLAWDRWGRLWATEFGQNRRDEVNLIRRGGNYGWPRVEGRGGGGRFADPHVVWQPAVASPSGAAFAGGALYVAALRGERLWRVPVGERRVGRPRALLAGVYGRLRHVAAAPDGSLWLLTSNRDGRGDPVAQDDRIIRLPRPPAT